jgi:hypothetical protein
MVAAAALAGCGGDKEAVTPETFAASCQQLLQTSCERYTDCLAPKRTDGGPTRDDYIRQCISDNERSDGRCMDRFARSECPAEEQAASERCEHDVRNAQCSALCTGDDFIFCWHPCLYFCPPKQPAR